MSITQHGTNGTIDELAHWVLLDSSAVRHRKRFPLAYPHEQEERVVNMIPTSAPERVRRAHDSMVPIFDFLAQYESWMANLRPTDCDFALGNPQTMPLQGFVGYPAKSVVK